MPLVAWRGVAGRGRARRRVLPEPRLSTARRGAATTLSRLGGSRGPSMLGRAVSALARGICLPPLSGKAAALDGWADMAGTRDAC